MTSKKQTPAPFITYAPEVEARRAEYRQVGAALAGLLHVQYRNAPEVLDIPPAGVLTDKHDPYILWTAIGEHLAALFADLSLEYGEDFWATLYPELRLYLDQQRFELRRPRRKAVNREP